MVEESRQQYEPSQQAAILHGLALDLVEKAEGRIDSNPGDSINYHTLYREAGALEIAAFRACPYKEEERRNELAVQGIKFWLTSGDYVNVSRFGQNALDDLGITATPVTQRKIRGMIEDALKNMPLDSIIQ